MVLAKSSAGQEMVSAALNLKAYTLMALLYFEQSKQRKHRSKLMLARLVLTEGKKVLKKDFVKGNFCKDPKSPTDFDRAVAQMRNLEGLVELRHDRLVEAMQRFEAALKCARARARARGSNARDVLAFRGGFHGRTAFALSATWTPAYREPFEPLMPGVRFADFNRVDQLDAVLDEGVAAVIVEPVQGEGGVIPATREFLQALRARTAALGAALVHDEVQCGMGRCGRLLASEDHGVRADYVVLSKALGGGLPLGAVLMTAEAAQALQSGMHGCTFGGGPVAATAGAYVLERVRKPGFLARVRRLGRALGAGLERLVARHASLAEARGAGLLRAVEIAAEAPYDPPALVAAARAHGLLLARGGERAVRLLPPLTVTKEEIALALERLERAIAELEAGGEQG